MSPKGVPTHKLRTADLGDETSSGAQKVEKRQFQTECYMWRVEGLVLVGWWGFMELESMSPELNRIGIKF